LIRITRNPIGPERKSVLPKFTPNTFEFVRLSRLYTARHGDDAELAPYPTLDALLSALHGKWRADPLTRRRLLCAVIALHQADPSALWSAVALHAFRGMLVHLSSKLRGVDRDDADSLVALGLLEALHRVHPERDPERIAMYVRQETRRAVFVELRREALARQYWPVQEDEQEESSPPEDEAPRGEDAETPGEPSTDGEADDEATSDETGRDPLAIERVSRHVDPDGLVDPESEVPFEDRMTFQPPTARAIPDEVLLRAHRVRGGLRRLTNHLFDDESPRARAQVYRRLWLRTQRLLARQE
jgi:hypothetical protein